MRTKHPPSPLRKGEIKVLASILSPIKKRFQTKPLFMLLFNNFQSLENAGELFYGDVHLFLGVGGH